METRPCTILEYFNGTKQMLVPLFQRPYEWGRSHWETLWLDLLERYEQSPGEGAATHFTGAIVTAPARSVPVGVSKHLVIDGQQRLTTVAILIAAIRSFVDKNSPRYRKLTRLLINEDDDGLDHLKLLPTQPDRAAFGKLVDGSVPNGTRIGDAFGYFRKQLSGTDSEGVQIDIERMSDSLQTQLTVVSIHLSETDDPYLIFESLNAKGAPLTQADLIRNYLLLRLHLQQQQAAYEAHWLPMQELLPNDHLTEFMRVYLMLNGEEVVKASIYAMLKKRLSLLPDAQIQHELAHIHLCARLYARIVGLTSEESTDLQTYLTRLRRWEIGVANPLILKLLDAREGGSVTTDSIVGALKVIESFAVRRWVCGVPTNQLKRIFLALTKDLPFDNVVPWLTQSLATGSIGRRWPKDEEFRVNWLVHRAYVAPLDRCRLILETLERDLGHKEVVSFAGLTIEHVLPQTLSAAWRTALGADAEDISETWGDTIGNLTLTAYNSELSNSPFEAKREWLEQSHVDLNLTIAEAPEWNQQTIEARANSLFAQARKLWSRPD